MPSGKLMDIWACYSASLIRRLCDAMWDRLLNFTDWPYHCKSSSPLWLLWYQSSSPQLCWSYITRKWAGITLKARLRVCPKVLVTATPKLIWYSVRTHTPAIHRYECNLDSRRKSCLGWNSVRHDQWFKYIWQTYLPSPVSWEQIFQVASEVGKLWYYSLLVVLLCVSVLVGYSYIISFQSEFSFIWRQSFNTASAIFYINRYLPWLCFIFDFVDICEGECACQKYLQTTFGCIVFLSRLSQAGENAIFLVWNNCIDMQVALPSLRIYAIWSQNIKLGVFVFLLFLIPATLQFVSISICSSENKLSKIINYSIFNLYKCILKSQTSMVLTV